MMAFKQRMYRPGEVAHLFGVHVDTVRQWMDDGRIGFIRIGLGKHRRVPFVEVERFRANRK